MNKLVGFVVIGILGVSTLGCSRSDQDNGPAKDPENGQVGKAERPKEGEVVVQKAPIDPLKHSDSKKKQEKEGITKRTAEGVGKTEDESLKDAFRKAIWQEVGVVVDAETIVKNDSIISDKILSYADGIVKSYKVVQTRKEHGLVWTAIEADIERRSVIAKVKQADLPIKKLDGKGIAAQALTDLEAAKNAKVLLDKALEGFPLNVMEATVSKPEIVKRNEKDMTCRFQVTFQVNQEQYYRFVSKLQNTLEVIAKERGETTGDSDGFPSRRNIKDSHTLNVYYAHRDELIKGRKVNKSCWKYYVLDESAYDSLIRSTFAIKSKASLLNKDEKEVFADSFWAGGDGKTPTVSPLWVQGWGNGHANSFIFPRFGPFDNLGQAICRPTLSLHRDITLPYKEWETVESVRCHLLDGGGSQCNPNLPPSSKFSR